MLMVGLGGAEAKKNSHFVALAMGHCMFAGTHGADAVSGGCFNPVVVIGIEVASLVGLLRRWELWSGAGRMLLGREPHPRCTSSSRQLEVSENIYSEVQRKKA